MRARYERVAVFLGLLLLFGSSFSVIVSAIELGSSLSIQAKAAAKQASPPPIVTELRKAIAMLGQPSQWTRRQGSGLFVPEKHFIGSTGFPTTLRAVMLHPPVPNDWFEVFDLSIEQTDVLNQDPDDDGFINLEEWEHQTNPTDPMSHPAFFTKLRMKSITQESFRLVFSSRVNETFAINTDDFRRPTQFLKLGDVIRGTQLRVVRFHERYDMARLGTRVDVSELVLENQENDEEIIMVKEKGVSLPRAIANFVYSWGGVREFSLRKGETFLLEPEKQTKYRVIDLQPTKAIIINTERPDELIEIDG